MAHKVFDTALTTDEKYDVEEYCPWCDNYIAVKFDEECPHLEIVCPVCQHKLMLCSMCESLSDHGICDWNEEKGCCMDKAHKT